jgi:hypothetical protein
MILSVFPNGVSMASNATVPTTKRLMDVMGVFDELAMRFKGMNPNHAT